MPFINEEEKYFLNKSIEDKWLTEGPFCARFLEHIKELTGSKYAVLAPNGTLGLFLSIIALDFPRGGEIIIPSFTFYASATSSIYAGLTPVFVDVDEKTFNIDVDKARNLITNKTVAIMPVHVYGHSSNMDAVIKLAHEYNIKIIEDAAQSYGVYYKDRHLGTFGDVSMISFFADKTITMGEGSVVLTQNNDIYEKLRLTRNQGRLNSGTFIHPEMGMNFRITDMQAGVGLAQAKKFNEIKKRKLYIYERYFEKLNGVGDLIFIEVEDGSTFVPFRFYIRTKYKNELSCYMEELGVQSRSFFYPMHLQPKLKQYAHGDLLISEKLYETGLCLPLHNYMNDSDVDYITSLIKKFFSNKKF